MCQNNSIHETRRQYARKYLRYYTAAKIALLHGKEYLDVFKKLHEEIYYQNLEPQDVMEQVYVIARTTDQELEQLKSFLYKG